MDPLFKQLNQLEVAIPTYETHKPHISKGSVGWHIAHSLLTLDVIITAIHKSNPKDYRYKFDIKRAFVSITGKIPRGRIKAPKVVEPPLEFDKESLTNSLASIKNKYATLQGLQPNHHFVHPFLGMINLKGAKRFMYIHTKHHANIIKDILQGN